MPELVRGTQQASHRQFWTDCYGSGFYDWYMETQVESAKGIEPQSSPLVQLALPRISFCHPSFESYLVDSF